MATADLLSRITSNATIFGGKPIIHGKRLAVEHVLSMLAAGDSEADLIAAYPFLEPDDFRACLFYAYKLVAHDEATCLRAGTAPFDRLR